MAASVENMFYVRETPWHGLGKRVNEALNSKEALTAAGLNWNVIQEPIYTETEELIEGYKAIRDADRQVLGVVTDRYKIVQNQEAFAFTDELLGEGVRYETAGSLQGGRKVWLLAICPMSILFLVRGSARIWCFSIPMMVPGQSKQQSHRFGLCARIH